MSEGEARYWSIFSKGQLIKLLFLINKLLYGKVKLHLQGVNIMRQT